VIAPAVVVCDVARLRDRPLLLPRILGALLIRADVYAGIGTEPRATPQAAIVVFLVAVLEASATAAVHGETVLDGARLLVALVAGVVGWSVWTLLLHGVAVRGFSLPAETGAIARVVGLAHAPGILMGLSLVPGAEILTGTLYAISILWFGAAMHAAVRGLFGVSPARALAIVALALVAHEALRQAVRMAGLAP
jgi:hypothetical protein